MNITKESIVGEVVAENYRYANVFKAAEIDFCCNGSQTIQEACEKQDINVNELLVSLTKVSTSSIQDIIDYQSWPLDLLADYIEKKHHRYVEQKIQEIKPLLSKIVKVHGHHHPELTKIEQLFGDSAGELTMHMKKEELVLFPFIRKMVQAKENNQSLPIPHFGTIQNPVTMMQHEHDTEGERFRKIASLSNNYTPPSDGCNTYRVTFALLKEFEEDLHLHIHLENNILFPKAIEIETGLR